METRIDKELAEVAATLIRKAAIATESDPTPQSDQAEVAARTLMVLLGLDPADETHVHAFAFGILLGFALEGPTMTGMAIGLLGTR